MKSFTAYRKAAYRSAPARIASFSWAEKVYPNLTHFNKVDKGGHFAAWEEPELFAGEVRTAFQSVR